MKRPGLVLALMGLMGLLVLVAVAVPALADEHIEPHPHMLLQRPEFGLVNDSLHLIGVRKCVDLANNHPVPLHAHHERLHFGDSGVSFGGPSGHAVLVSGYFPTEDNPLPWGNCEEFEAILPLPLGGE